MLRYPSLELPLTTEVEYSDCDVPSLLPDTWKDSFLLGLESPSENHEFDDISLSHEESPPQTSHKMKTSKATTIQEYTQLVMDCMQSGKEMSTTEVARKIMDKVHPRPFSLTVNIRRRVGDALSVLSAIHKVTKTKRGYMWINSPSGNTSFPPSNERDSLITLRRELQKKQKVLQMLKEKVEKVRIMEQNVGFTENPKLNILTQSKSRENTNYVDYIPSDDSQTIISIDLSEESTPRVLEDLVEENRTEIPNELLLSHNDVTTLSRSPSFNVINEIDLNNPFPSIPMILDFSCIPDLAMN